MQVQVRLSAGLVRAGGRPRLTLEVPAGATVRDALALLPAAVVATDRLAAAVALVAGRHAALTDPLQPGQELALLLPVAGG